MGEHCSSNLHNAPGARLGKRVAAIGLGESLTGPRTLIKVRTQESANVTIQTAKLRPLTRRRGRSPHVAVRHLHEAEGVVSTANALGRRIKKVVTNAGDFDKTEVYFYDGQQIVQINNGSGAMVQQFIHGTQYIDELVMVRVKDKGDLYVHQGERSEREWAATGKASRMRASGPRARPKGASRRRTIAGANWNVIGLTDLGRHVVERYVYTPYGELIVHQDTGFGDRDGDGKVDSTDKGTVGTTCTGTVSGACRILDLNFDGNYDSTDATKFDALTQGAMRHPGRPATNVSQPFAHQGLLFEPELAQYQDRARQYDPAKRRFVQRDPLSAANLTRGSYEDGLSPYQYTRSNPLRRVDPSGLLPGLANCMCPCKCSEEVHDDVLCDGVEPQACGGDCQCRPKGGGPVRHTRCKIPVIGGSPLFIAAAAPSVLLLRWLLRRRRQCR